MIRFTAVLSANPAPASAKTRPRQKLRFGDLAREIARSVLTIVLFDNERGGRWEGGEVPISWIIYDVSRDSILNSAVAISSTSAVRRGEDRQNIYCEHVSAL